MKPVLNRSINKVIISNLHCAPLPPSRALGAFKGITAEQSRQCKCVFMLCLVGVFVCCCRVILMSPCVVEEIVFYSGVYAEPTQALMSIHEQQADRDMTKHTACAAYLQYCSLKQYVFTASENEGRGGREWMRYSEACIAARGAVGDA